MYETITKILSNNHDYTFDECIVILQDYLLALFDDHEYTYLANIIYSQYWKVFEHVNEELMFQYCYKPYQILFMRREFIYELCKKIDFTNYLHLFEQYFHVNKKKRCHSEMETNNIILNKHCVDNYIIDYDFYNLIVNKYYKIDKNMNKL